MRSEWRTRRFRVAALSAAGLILHLAVSLHPGNPDFGRLQDVTTVVGPEFGFWDSVGLESANSELKAVGSSTVPFEATRICFGSPGADQRLVSFPLESSHHPSRAPPIGPA